MKKVSHKDVKGSSPEGTKGVDFRPLLAENVNPPNFYLRVFDISPGGNTPLHRHAWEHEVFVVRGKGKIVLDGREEPLEEGDAVFVEPEELHQFVNGSGAMMRMICVIPRPKDRA
jgi:quercetin dioxygenase-like cupin family protein